MVIDSSRAHQIIDKPITNFDRFVYNLDSFKKIIITQVYEDRTEIAGIPIINIIDWLLD
ncbi:ATP-binding protein [Lactovum odontotermitis]